MPYTLEALPYAMDALEPFISKETLEFHYGKHHQGYVTKLNGLLSDHSAPLTTLLTTPSTSTAVYNNAAQIWNHTFYWKCMTSASKQSSIPSHLDSLLVANFGSVEDFKKKFETAAASHFGSGWVWLVQGETKGSLLIMDTHDAQNPLSEGLNPLLVLDVWEHAYYIDKRNNRLGYIQEWFKLINWDFVASNIKETPKL